MSKLLATLAGKSEQEYSQVINTLEEMSGFSSEDVRHLANATQKLRVKISQLGLDPDDTTGEELYHALLARYSKDAASLDRALGVKHDSTLAERSQKAVQLINHCVEFKNVWALKNSIAKNLIKQNPPKKLMKQLHYRSVDSLLKRQDIAAIFIAADLVELPTWHHKLEAKLAGLNTAAYELRFQRVVCLPELATLNQSSELSVINGAVGAVATHPCLTAETPILTIALGLIDGLDSLNENTLTHKLHNCHPALAWWSDAEHLISLHNGQPVSLNFQDVALNHLLKNNFDSRIFQKGQQTFWAQLMARYRKYVDELPQEAAVVRHNINQSFKPAIELVPEMIEV